MLGGRKKKKRNRGRGEGIKGDGTVRLVPPCLEALGRTDKHSKRCEKTSASFMSVHVQNDPSKICLFL